MFSPPTDLGEICSSVWLPQSQQAGSRGWLTSSTTYLHAMRCHQNPPKGASRPHETMSNSYKTQLELCYCGTGRLDKISRPQHSFVSADASGMFLLQLLLSKRKQALKHNVHWNQLSSEESRVAPASRCAFYLQLSSPDAFPLFVLGGRQPLNKTHSCTR